MKHKIIIYLSHSIMCVNYGENKHTYKFETHESMINFVNIELDNRIINTTIKKLEYMKLNFDIEQINKLSKKEKKLEKVKEKLNKAFITVYNTDKICKITYKQ